MQEILKKHVAALPFPFGTHASPLLAIIRRLASAAATRDDVDVLFSFFGTSKFGTPLFPTDAKPRDNVIPYEVWDGVPQGYVFSGMHQEDIDLFIQAAPSSFAEGIKAAEAETGRKVTCIIMDAFLWFAGDMARDLDVPWISFWAGGPASLTAHLHTDLLREKLLRDRGIAGREDETLEFIPGLSKVRVRDLQEGVVFGNLESKFSTMLHQMGKALGTVFLNCFENLDPTINADLKTKLTEILGPVELIGSQAEAPVSANTGCLSWLDEQRTASVVYVGFGTVLVPPAKELVELAEALEESEAPFIWSLKEQVWPSLPQGFLERTAERGKVVAWAPQKHILRHASVGAFLTHCEWNSVLECIAAGGPPMICRPFFGDQRLNGRMVELLGMGIAIKGGLITKTALVSCLETALTVEKGRKMRDYLMSLKAAAQEAVGTNGSSFAHFQLLLEAILS